MNSENWKVNLLILLPRQYIANLTLAQIKTLDCGSLRQTMYPFQLLYPGIKLATLPEFFVRRCTFPTGYTLTASIL